MRVASLNWGLGLLFVIASSTGAQAITRGEVKDRLAASEVEQCAAGYISRGTSGMTHTEAWTMCAEAAAELARRPLEGVKARVVIEQGYDVFTLEKKP